MNCPACNNQLQQITVSGINLDVCKGGCGGIWFDNFELKKFDEQHESAPDELINIEKSKNIKVDRNKKYKCPKCDDMVMMRHYFSVKRDVQIDTCPNCAGIWLDAEELKQIRSLFKSEAEKKSITDAHYSQMFDPELKIMKAGIKGQTENEPIAKKLFTFLFSDILQ